MPDHQLLTFVGMIVGPFIGSYFGLKSSLNGIKGSAQRIEADLKEVRDIVRDSKRIGEETLQELKCEK